MTSTHTSDPLLPHGVQPPSNELESATLALAEEENKLSSFEFAMAVAAQAMRNDLGVKMWLMHCTTQPGAERVLDIGFSSCAAPNYLILMSEYVRCILGTLRIPEVSEVVQEFGSKSRTGA